MTSHGTSHCSAGFVVVAAYASGPCQGARGWSGGGGDSSGGSRGGDGRTGRWAKEGREERRAATSRGCSHRSAGHRLVGWAAQLKRLLLLPITSSEGPPASQAVAQGVEGARVVLPRAAPRRPPSESAGRRPQPVWPIGLQSSTGWGVPSIQRDSTPCISLADTRDRGLCRRDQCGGGSQVSGSRNPT